MGVHGWSGWETWIALVSGCEIEIRVCWSGMVE